MKRKLVLVLMLVLMLLMLVPFEALAQEIVDDTAASVQELPLFIRSFYAEGRYWEAYNKTISTIDHIVIKSSLDGTTWSSYTELFGDSGKTARIDICLDSTSTYIHVVRNTNLANTHSVYYDRGKPNSDGTITWSSGTTTPNWQLITGSFDAYALGQASVTLDGDGYPYISYGTGYNFIIKKSSTKNGSFTTEWTKTINDGASAGYFGRVVGLTDGKIVALYGHQNPTPADWQIRAMRWTGLGWGAEVKTTYIAKYASYFSAVAQDDNVHIVALKATSNDIFYTEYSSTTNTFGAETTIYSGATSTSIPAMSMDNANNLHVFWENDPTDDHMYYAKYIYDESTWVSYYDLINEIDLLPATGYYLNTDYTCDENRVGVYYIADSTILKFKLLGEVFHVDTKDADPIGDTTATLQGEIISLGFGSATERGFWINDTPSLSGATQEGNETGTFNVGVFTHGITGLTEGYKYYYCAYASNDYGLEYGTWSQFTAGGSAGGIAVLTLDPTDVGDFEATFNGNIVATGGDYLSMRGFQWGFSDTPTWLWDEGGNFTVGTFAYTPTDLEADSIYYVRAIAGNGTDTDYGQWIGFITEQPSYVPGEGEIGNDTGLLPPLPEEPGGWIRPPKDWGSFNDIPWTFVMFLVSLFFLVAVGLALTKYTRSLAVTFMVLGFFLGVLCFWPKGGYLDWWVLFPYALVGWALLQRQSESPIAE